jgi:hypothetical protein
MIDATPFRLGGVMGALLAVLLSTGSVTPAAAQVPSALDEGLRLYEEGDLGGAVLALDSALGVLPPSDTASLVKAYVYRGAALVGLGQEEPAKTSFRAALVLDPALRLRNTEFPDRIVRVFEAARSGRSKSVMQRPNPVPKKAGIGAAGVAAIVGGVFLAGGAVAVAAAKSSGDSSIEEGAATFPGGFSVRFLSSNPAPGSTIHVGRGTGARAFPLSMTFSVRAETAASGDFRADLFKDDRDCASGQLVPFTIAAGGTLTITVPSATYQPDVACTLPVATNRIVVQLLLATFSGSVEGIAYSLVE